MTSNIIRSFAFHLTQAKGSRVAFQRSSQQVFAFSRTALFSSSTSPDKSETAEKGESEKKYPDDHVFTPPWNDPMMIEKAKEKKNFRSRQHVNPLSRRFQMPTVLTPDWPRDMFDDLSKPLFLDIGCSRGGFLIDAANKSKEGGENNPVAGYNFLGLEIRPIVVYHAQERVKKHDLGGFLGFVGCNANVDLERLLTLAEAQDNLKMVAIQFPDPHFKAQHAKRRVVTPDLVTSLARFMPAGAQVFLQSDIKNVLDDMREQFRLQSDLFDDYVAEEFVYGVDNIFGIPTEREVSVLEKDLPVYRALFTRTGHKVE